MLPSAYFQKFGLPLLSFIVWVMKLQLVGTKFQCRVSGLDSYGLNTAQKPNMAE